MNDEKIARINALYHKSKDVGLTKEEKEEQQLLRREYIEAIRGNMRATLDHTSIKNADGTLTPLKIVRQKNLASRQPDVLNVNAKDPDKIEDIEGIKKKKTAVEKKKIREILSEKRNVLTPHEVNQRSGIIYNHIVNSDFYKNCDKICVYMAFRNEVSCSDVIQQAYNDGKHVFVPVVDETDKTMDFYEISNNTKWKDGAYGIKEPVINNSNKKLTVDDKTLILMPGLAFDRNKNRIGYGGGYYDKYLEKNIDGVKMALCYSFQIIDKIIPCDNDDIIPDYIVTENGIF